MQFNSIPNNLRVPFSYVEFSNSSASSGSVAQPYKLLLIGQKLSTGTQAAGAPVLITSKAQAKGLFGAGSMLADMISKAIDANSLTEMWAVALDDDAAGVKSIGSVQFAGPATKDGTVSIYVAGKVYNIAVLTGDSAAAIATSAAAILNGDADAPFTAAVDGTTTSKVNLTARHKGLVPNGITIVPGYYGELNPAGVTLTITAFAGGTVNPSVAPAIAGIGDNQFRTIVMPYHDAANLSAMETEMLRRWGPLLANDGHVFVATNLSTGAAQTLGLSRNSPFITILDNAGSPSPNWQTAAVLGAVVARESATDPARPLQTVLLTGILAPLPQSRQLISEQNTLLYSGISTVSIDSGSNVLISRLITTYKTDAQGNIDESYLNYETMATLSFLRFSFRGYFGRKYPRHKLANDGTRFATGAAVITPLIAKAECVALFREWEDAGLVEDGDQFKRDLLVQRNASNPDRLDFYLPPNLINGLRIIAAQIAFRS